MKLILGKLSSSASVISLFLLQSARLVAGHYGFPFVLIDGIASKRWEYIRPSSSFGPNFDYAGPDAMCGPNATKAMFPVKTLKVAAGSTVTFGASGQTSHAREDEATEPFDPGWYIYHDGPATAYLSKAPGELNDYAGDGEWFKIAAVGASDGLLWDYSQNNRVNTLNFTIPKSTPPGKYLMRAEHLNIMDTYQATQMYANCAHIEITGDGAGTPGPTTKFPGAFSAKDSGIWLPNALYRPYKPLDQLKDWQGAGPKVWTG